MSLKDQLAADAVNTFLNEDEFSESIVYTPKGGTAKTIQAVRVRGSLAPDGETDRLMQDRQEIVIANHETYGVTSVNRGGDKVTFPAVTGGADCDWVVVDIIDDDEGMFHLLLQK